MTMAVATSHAEITAIKNSRSRMSRTPLLMESKWVRKLREPMASVRICGAQLENALSTIGEPEATKMKQIATVRINATTALRYIADMQDPLAMNQRAINHLPMTAARLTQSS